MLWCYRCTGHHCDTDIHQGKILGVIPVTTKPFQIKVNTTMIFIIGLLLYHVLIYIRVVCYASNVQR